VNVISSIAKMAAAAASTTNNTATVFSGGRNPLTIEYVIPIFSLWWWWHYYLRVPLQEWMCYEVHFLLVLIGLRLVR
jgi:hypothetical protein